MIPLVSLKKRLRYSLDNLYSRGTGAMVLSLGALSLLIILAAAVILTLTGLAPGAEAPYDFPEAAWMSLLRTLGSGTIGGRDSLWGFRYLMLGVTLGGLFVFSSLIGVLTTGMQNRLEELRQGRSEVMETGHTVILGWSEDIFTILPELVAANASERRACIVILGEREKIAMEAEIRKKVGSTGRTRLVCRTGNPMEMSDLNTAGLNTARSILVLSPDSANPDADIFKVVLAILNHPDRRKEKYHIVAALRNPKNAGIARAIGKEEVEWIQMGDTISRLIAQASRQPGLSVVYTRLLDFKGSEIYFCPAPALEGRTFGESLLSAGRCTVIGLLPHGGKPQLNPPVDTRIGPGDQIIVIAKDNHLITFQPDKPAPVDEAAIRHLPLPAQHPERTLILGWNWRTPGVIRELDHYVAPGSQVLVMADRAGILESIERDCQNLKNLEVCYTHGDTADRESLERLGLHEYEHVILMSYTDRMSVQQADAQTLITLLHLRDIAQYQGLNYSVLSELLDARNRRLAAVLQADDFIASDRLTSLILTQVAENRLLNMVYDDLFDPNSAELYLRSAERYVQTNQAVNFSTVVAAACRQGEVAVGYRLASAVNDPDGSAGVKLNPHKSAEIVFEAGDQIIVLANG